MKILLLTCNILPYLKIKSVATMSLKPKGMMVKEDKGQNADDPGIKRCPSVDKAQHPVLYLRNRSTQIKTYSWDNAQVLLVGNKCDMEDERVVAAERGRQLSEQLGKSTRKKKTRCRVSFVFTLLVFIVFSRELN